ncbi:MAG: class I SAM-dependent methyltransferase [Phycisphaeraceae bacterium]|nr:class I SAM-dependent methyltransferase [Phycisphaeraceae bacterium]
MTSRPHQSTPQSRAASPASHVDPVIKHLRELRIRHKPACPYFTQAERAIDDQWGSIIAPRLEILRPDLSHVLEIACGHGRNTARLLELGAARLTAVDIQPHCVEACVARFPAEVRSGRLRLRVNDGLTLPMVETGTVSLAYTFDSLVHMEWPIVESYLREIARVLKPAGTAFIHHSNFAALPSLHSVTNPKWFDNPHWRSNCSASQVRELAVSLGFEIVAQDLIPWGEVPDLDAITLLRKR